MKVIEVNTPQLDHSFLAINVLVNKDNPNYIRALDNEVLATFDPSKNKLLKEGAAKSTIKILYSQEWLKSDACNSS